MAVSIMLVGMFVSSCSNRRFRLRNISDALAVCRFQLDEMRPRSNASIGELVDMINTTQTVTDSLSLFITRDTTIAKNPKAQQEIYRVTDSLRNEITRLTFSEKRSLSDAVYIVTKTVGSKDRIVDEKLHKQAERFFSKISKNDTFKDAETSIREYENLLADSDYLHITSREIFRDFLKKEDMCFRSMLKFLPAFSDETLLRLTTQTSEICNTFYGQEKETFAPFQEIAIYMTVRYNSRILQNAEECRNQVMEGVHLTPEQARLYRWMMLQPFFNINGYSLGALSSGQQQLFMDIAEDMPETLGKLARFTGNKPEQTENLIETLSTEFLKSHIKNII